MSNEIKIMDVTLRDGMHAVSHSLTAEKMAELAAKIDETGVDSIEFGHGNGLAGSSFQYGFAACSDMEYIKAVAKVVKKSKLSIIIIPGIGTRDELEIARDYGVKIARFATQITEADIAEEHIKMAKKLGFETRSVLACASVISVEDTVRQAQLIESYGGEAVILSDGAGYMLPEQVYERINAIRKNVAIPVGLHAHNNLQLAVANALAAVDAGATHIDVSLKGFGAGAGNCPSEVFIAVCNRKGIRTGVDLFSTMDVGSKYLKPLMLRPMELDNDRLMLGYAGCYSSFVLFAQRAGEKYGVDPREIILEIGKRQCAEGQEDMCIEVAYDLSQKNNQVKNN